MNQLKTLYNDIIESMGVQGLSIPMTAVKIYKNNDTIPNEVLKLAPTNISLSSCQANKQASLGDAVCLTIDNIGCVAAAITFGFVDENQNTPLDGSRVYTDIMKDQSGKSADFVSPSPKDFTDGIVYACKESKRNDFAMFGKEDSGRFKNQEIAKRAIKDMMALQPADTKAVFFYPYHYNEIEITPDVIVLSVRPAELARLIEAYQFNTGKRVCSSMGGLRVVNSDLIVRPYLTQEINISSFCLGARLIGQYEADRIGMGMPFKDFKTIAQGMKDSRTGFPFHMYPGADENSI